MSEKREGSDDAAPASGPGARLRTMRKEIGISVDEVAEALRLSPKLILAIEDERYEDMPEQAYARGHVRSYAKLMEIDADQCVAEFNEASEQYYRGTSEVAGRPLTLDSPKVSIVDNPLHYVGWILGSIIIAIVLMAGIVLWYLWQDSDEVALLTESDAMPSFSKASTEDPAADIAEAIPHHAPRSPPPVPDRDVTASAAREADAPDGASDADATRRALEADRPAQRGAPVLSAAESAVTVAEASRANASPISTTVGGDPAGADAAATTDILQFSFIEDCWVEVYDRHGATIHFGLERAPGQLNLRGEPPFTVRLGNGPGVRLVYNDNEVALDPNARNNVAELTLGE